MIFQDFSESFPDAVVKAVQSEPQPDTPQEPDTTPTESSDLIPAYTFEDFASTDKPYAWLYEQKGNPFLQQQLIQKMNAMAKSVKYSSFLGTWKKYQEVREPKQQLMGDFVTMFPEQPVQLHCGTYVADEFGVIYAGRNGEAIEVCSHPIMPVKRIVDAETHLEKLAVAFKRGEDGWRTIVADREQFASAQKVVSLASKGIAVNSENAKEIVKYITELESLNYNEIPVEQSVSRLGWLNNQFIPYTPEYTFHRDEPQLSRIFNSIRQSGDIEQWKKAFSPMRNHLPQFLPFRIVIATSFASALIRPMGKLPFWTHLHSVLPGTAKTVTIMGAASVWGNPSREAGLIQTLKITPVALEFLDNFLCDIPVILDELQVVQDRVGGFSDFIYQHCEGIGKGRGNKNGGLQQQTSWSNAAISTGEMHILLDTDHAGSFLRVIDVPAKEKIIDNPKEFLAIIRCNYGFAGKIFTEAVAGNLEKVTSSVEHCSQFLMDNYGIASKQADTGALLIVADKVADNVIFHDNITLSPEELVPFLKC